MDSKNLKICPITALLFHNEKTLLTGAGNEVLLYQLVEPFPFGRIEVFKRSVVHGIRHSEHIPNVCVFGGRSLRIISVIPGYRLESRHREIQLYDWIWETAWLEDENGKYLLGCVLGHNVYVLYDWQRELVINKIACEEGCILYCAKVLGQTVTDAIVSSGTVFQEVLLWKPCCTTDADLKNNREVTAKVVHRLTGHEGVIFAMYYDEDSGLFASASDDRSIRLWKCSQPDITALETATFSLQRVICGHEARVWDVKVLRGHVISIGEDSSLRIWKSNGWQVAKFTGHCSKSIWSLAISPCGQAAVTGGGDSCIQYYPLCDILEPDDEDSERVIMCDLALNTPRNVAFAVSEGSSNCSLMAAMDSGEIYLYDIPSKATGERIADIVYNSYTVIASKAGLPFIAVGSLTGEVAILDRAEYGDSETCYVVRSKHVLYAGKVYSLQWLNKENLLSTGPDGKLDMWVYRHEQLVACKSFSLPYCKQRWVTAAVLVPDTELLVCGDRGGAVHVFHCGAMERDAPRHSFIRVHGKDGVTDVIYHRDVLFSVGHDGTMSTYIVTESDCVTWLCREKLHKDMCWLARFIVLHGDLLILSFISKNFCVYYPALKQVLVTIECGGGHRSWDFYLCPETREFSFAYIVKKEICVHVGRLKPYQTVVRPALHGHQIHECVHLKSGEFGRVVVTASEDGTVKVVQLYKDFASEQYLYKVLDSLPGHLSSVKTITYSRELGGETESGFECVLFSGGGRSELKSWKLKLSVSRDKVACTHSPCDVSSSGKSKKPAGWDESADYRVMSLCCFTWARYERQNEETFVAAACSDGIIRLYSFSTSCLMLIGQSVPNTHCLLKIIVQQRGKEVALIYTDTSGKLFTLCVMNVLNSYFETCLDENASLSSDAALIATGLPLRLPLPSQQAYISVHELGINALAARESRCGYYVVTGGDDGAVSVIHRDIVKMKWCMLDSVKSAHVCQVTGVRFLNDLVVLSAGIDQQVNIWTLNDQSKLSLSRSYHVSVADVSDVCLWRYGDEHHAACVGCGLQAMKLDNLE